MKFRLPFVPLLVLFSACGGKGNPTMPSGPGPSSTPLPGGATNTLTLVRGDLDTGVFRVEVNAAGNSTKQSDENGVVTFDHPIKVGDPYDATASGFQTRVSTIRSLTERLTLWPVDRYPAAFYKELVFSEFFPGGRLSRPAFGPTVLVMSPEVQSARASIENAATVNTVATSQRINYLVADEAVSGVRAYMIRLNAFQANPCQTEPVLRGNVLDGGTITCRDLTELNRYIAHEVGHTLGLGHDNGTLRGLMFSLTTLTNYTEAEKMAIHLMLQRFPGTSYPDNDRGAQALGRTTSVVIGCGKPDAE